MPRTLGLVLAVIMALVQPLATGFAGAADGDVGYRDGHFAGIGTEVTGAKPESKLWWADGAWWSVMWDEAGNSNFIHRLDLATQRWTNTGVRVDGRATTRSDALWDGSKLYVASHIFSTLGGAGQVAHLYRFSYSPDTDRYTLDTGFPTTINSAKSESLVIDKDSTGKLWATWVQDARVYVNTSASGAVWGTPSVLPVTGATNLTTDDISSVVSFSGNRIGVMWSHQNDSAMYFAEHVDGAPDGEWQASRTALQGPGNADDHINLKSLHAGTDGTVYAATKTSHTSGAAPLVMLLVREPYSGEWDSHVFGQVRDHHTRPIVMIDDVNRSIYMFATSNEAGGTIYMKSSPMDDISFAPGPGTPFIRDAASPDMNDATSTKQSVNPASGLVVLASDDTTDFYWHNYLALGNTPETLAAGFSATPRTGTSPVQVRFTDTSTGSPTSWLWDFGDGTTSTQQNPTHEYSAAGAYDVSLTVADAAGATSTSGQPAYVTVEEAAPAAPVAGFSATPRTGTAPMQVAFTDTSTGGPTSWLWDFGDGTDSTEQNPTHTYSTAGRYTVALTATSASGSHTRIEPGYVTVGGRSVIAASADTYVRSQQATTNFGSRGDLRVRLNSKDTYRSHLAFSVGGLAGPVVGARLRLQVAAGGIDGGTVFRTGAAWAEGTVNWNNAPPPTGSALGHAGPVTAGTFVEIALPSSTFASGNDTYSFVIGVTNPISSMVQYGSREGGSAPQLILDLGPPQ